MIKFKKSVPQPPIYSPSVTCHVFGGYHIGQSSQKILLDRTVTKDCTVVLVFSEVLCRGRVLTLGSCPAKDPRDSCYFRQLLVFVSWVLLPQGPLELPHCLGALISTSKKPPHLLSQKSSVSLLANKVPDGLS